MDIKTKILEKIFEPTPQHCQTARQDLQLAITLNPDLSKIEQAMEEYALQSQPEREEKGLEKIKEVHDCLISALKDYSKRENSAKYDGTSNSITWGNRAFGVGEALGILYSRFPNLRSNRENGEIEIHVEPIRLEKY